MSEKLHEELEDDEDITSSLKREFDEINKSNVKNYANSLSSPEVTIARNALIEHELKTFEDTIPIEDLVEKYFKRRIDEIKDYLSIEPSKRGRFKGYEEIITQAHIDHRYELLKEIPRDDARRIEIELEIDELDRRLDMFLDDPTPSDIRAKNELELFINELSKVESNLSDSKYTQTQNEVAKHLINEFKISPN